MSIILSGNGTVELSGSCPVEDAELLLQQLVANPHAVIDWSACESAHSAIIQVLLVAGSVPKGIPMDAFLADKVAPLLARRK